MEQEDDETNDELDEILEDDWYRYFDGPIPSIQLDGVYTANTLRKVADFLDKEKEKNNDN